MANFDDFPVKPKFQVGDEVFYLLDARRDRPGSSWPVPSMRVVGKIRHIRASVGSISRKKDTPRISYGYTVGGDPTVIEESELNFTNPLLRFTKEVHDGA